MLPTIQLSRSDIIYIGYVEFISFTWINIRNSLRLILIFNALDYRVTRNSCSAIRVTDGPTVIPRSDCTAYPCGVTPWKMEEMAKLEYLFLFRCSAFRFDRVNRGKKRRAEWSKGWRIIITRCRFAGVKRSLEGAKASRNGKGERNCVKKVSNNAFEATRMVDRRMPGQREEGGTEGGGKRARDFGEGGWGMEREGGEAMAW